jgi:hypothetical protein
MESASAFANGPAVTGEVGPVAKVMASEMAAAATTALNGFNMTVPVIGGLIRGSRPPPTRFEDLAVEKPISSTADGLAGGQAAG